VAAPPPALVLRRMDPGAALDARPTGPGQGLARRQDLLAAADPDGHDRHTEARRQIRAPVEEVDDVAAVPTRALGEDGDRLPRFEGALSGAQRGTVGAPPL